MIHYILLFILQFLHFTNITKATRLECFGFFSGNYLNFNWTTVTTVVPTTLDIATDFSPNGTYYTLTKHAHVHNARVAVFAAAIRPKYPLPLNGSHPTEQAAWISRAVQIVQQYNLDGINFDYEEPLNATDYRNEGYVRLVNQTRIALLKMYQTNKQKGTMVPQVSVDVGWSSDHIDGRFYNGLGLAAASDYLYVMGYDLRSQYSKSTAGNCLAGANAALSNVRKGLINWINLGVPSSKLILGVPWYGFAYTCVKEVTDKCIVNSVPFRGSPCSDAAGGEVPFVGILPLLKDINTTRKWDGVSSTPYLAIMNGDNLRREIWYDDVESLTLKMALVKELGLGGGGPYEFSDLDYMDEKSTKEMWDTLVVLNEN